MDTQWSQFAVAFRDINPSGWHRLVVTREKFFAESCNSAGSLACSFALLTPSMPGVCAPFDEGVIRAASASHSDCVIRRSSRSIRLDGPVAANVASLRCISLIMNNLKEKFHYVYTRVPVIIEDV